MLNIYHLIHFLNKILSFIVKIANELIMYLNSLQ
jgi:hypothetical protein